jgi:hypothetical protein
VQLTTAMLADAAQVQGGKLYVLGGGFDTIVTRNLPAVQRSLAVVLVASIDPSERHQDLELSIALLDEDGAATGLEAKGRVRVGAPANLPPGAPSTVPIVSQFANVRFPEAKGYTFVVSYENQELTRVPCRVVKVG